MVAKYPDVVLKKVDLTDRNSQVAARNAQAFGVRTIPDVRVYAPGGKAVGKASDLGAIEDLIRKARP